MTAGRLLERERAAVRRARADFPYAWRRASRRRRGVVWRPAGVDHVEVCLVHRPRYGDWTLPKGKLEPGEHPLLAAAREVAEEADAQAAPQLRLPSVRYLSEGRLKVVDYWAMRAVGTGGFQPDTEVDEVRWLAVDDAMTLVSYPHDVEVLAAFAALPPVTAALVLVRHGHAGKRLTWPGPDTGGQLDARGWSEAQALAPLIGLIRPARLLSASPRRCVQTLDPAAALLDLPIEICGDLDEPNAGQQPDECVLAAAARLGHRQGRRLAARLHRRPSGRATVSDRVPHPSTVGQGEGDGDRQVVAGGARHRDRVGGDQVG